MPPQKSTCFFVHLPFFHFAWDGGGKGTKINHLVTNPRLALEWSSHRLQCLSPSYKQAQIFPIPLNSSPDFASLFSHCPTFLLPCGTSGRSWLHLCLDFSTVSQSLFTQIYYLALTSATLLKPLKSPHWFPNCHIVWFPSVFTLLLIQTVVHGPGSRTSPGSLLQMQNYPTLGLLYQNLLCDKISRWLSRTLTLRLSDAFDTSLGTPSSFPSDPFL